MIPLLRPHITEPEILAVAETLRSGWLGKGPLVDELEGVWDAYTDRYSVAVNSCTSALFLALKAFGIGPGDEVIVPTITFASTAHVVEHVGADVVFADVDDDLLIDMANVMDKITDRTAAIIPVHMAGRMVDLGPLCKWANEKGVLVIEDCAHAAGAYIVDDGIVTTPGQTGHASCWSFHAVKNVAAGDGGMVCFRDPELATWARRMSWLGIDKSTHDRSEGSYAWDYEIAEPGYKLHMNDIAATLALGQYDRLYGMHATRVSLAAGYHDMLPRNVERQRPLNGHAWHLYQIRVKARDRAPLMAYMAEQGISTGVHYRPLHTHKCYEHIDAKCPHADRVWTSLVSLPMHAGMLSGDVATVCDAVEGYYEQKKGGVE